MINEGMPRAEMRNKLVGLSVELCLGGALDNPDAAMMAYRKAMKTGKPTWHNYRIEGIPGVATWTPLPTGEITHEGRTFYRSRRSYIVHAEIREDRWVSLYADDGKPIDLVRIPHGADVVGRSVGSTVRRITRGKQSFLKAYKLAVKCKIPASAAYSIDQIPRFATFLPSDPRTTRVAVRIPPPVFDN